MLRSGLMNDLKTCCSIAGIACEKDLAIHQAIQEYPGGRGLERDSGVMPEENNRMVPKIMFRHPAIQNHSGLKIAIIGAGLAGLVCAYRLCQSGFCPKIYEAAERPGGRCCTIYGAFLEDQIAEQGGELIGSDHYAIINLAREFGLKLDNMTAAQACGAQSFYYFDGRPYTHVQAACAFGRIYPKLKKDYAEAGAQTTYRHYTARGCELDHISVADWISQTVPGGLESDFGKLLNTAYMAEFGGEPCSQSALNIVYMLGGGTKYPFEIFGKSDQKYHIHGGNSLLVQGLVEQLPKDSIEFGAQLTAIRKCPGNYQLSLLAASGQRCVEADIVLLAIPFAVLHSKVDFRDACFSPRKIQAIENLGMGTNTKLNVQFENRFWTRKGCSGSTFTDTGYQHTWEVTRAQPGKAGILAQLTGGNTGASFSDPEGLARYTIQFICNLNPVLPGISSQWNSRAVINHWTGYPWALGSYPYYKTGQYTSIAGAEALPEGNCFFAGDHTSLDFQGFMNGAVESGERAAGEMLDVLMGSRRKQKS